MTEYTTDDLLNDSFTPEAEEVSEPEAETVTGESQATEAAAETAAAEEVKAEEASTPEAESKEPETEEPWTYKAVKTEREKRQAAENRIKELEQQLTGSKQPEAEKPDWYDDPEKAAGQQAQQFQSALLDERIELTSEMMRIAHDDFDEKVELFYQLAEKNPQLARDAVGQRNPARFMYETANKHSEYQAMQNVDEYKAKLKAEALAEAREEARRELQAEQEKQQKKDAAILPSLAGTPSRGGLSSSDYSGPTPLNDILQ